MTGEVGTGKTTLIHSLLDHLDQKVRTVLIFHTTITFTDLLKTILQELDLAIVRENRTDLLQQLVQLLVLMGKRGETLVIIIDEAHKLPQKTLEGLQTFSDLKSKGIQILFVGQPEFEDRLNSENLKQLKQSVAISRQIRSLSEEESKEYIDHRLRLSGSDSSRIFSPKALSLICSYAQGIPRAINTLCDNALLVGSNSFERKIDVDIVREAIKNMEGPNLQKRILSSTYVVKKFHAFPFGLQFSLKKASLIIIIFLLCLGTLILLTRRHGEQKSVKTWEIKSLKSHHLDTGPSFPSTPSQTVPPSAPSSLTGREYKLKEMIVVNKGQTISQLTQKYYGVVNLTLIDFLLEANPEITNVHLIVVDQRIKIPSITEELLMIQSADHSYKIRVGTFETPDSARLYSEDPVLKGEKVEILPQKVSPRETWYRLMIGNFENKDEALKTISLLRRKGVLPAFEGIQKMK
jgi:general secretion pathway protein A